VPRALRAAGPFGGRSVVAHIGHPEARVREFLGSHRSAVRIPLADSVLEGRLKIGRDVILNNLQPSLRDLIKFDDVPRTSVLG
jgi:hypothetical protein